MREFPAQESRVETGVVQFGDDWPGVFIRGDSCHAYSLYLKEVLDTFRLHPVAYANLAGLRALLESPLHTTSGEGAAPK